MTRTPLCGAARPRRAVLVPLELLGIGLSIRSAFAGRLPRRIRLAWAAVAAAFAVLVSSGIAFGLASGLGLDRPAGYSALMVMYLVRILLAPLLLAAVFSFPAPPLTRRAGRRDSRPGPRSRSPPGLVVPQRNPTPEGELPASPPLTASPAPRSDRPRPGPGSRSRTVRAHAVGSTCQIRSM